jgi:hypothetical protein
MLKGASEGGLGLRLVGSLACPARSNTSLGCRFLRAPSVPLSLRAGRRRRSECGVAINSIAHAIPRWSGRRTPDARCAAAATSGCDGWRWRRAAASRYPCGALAVSIYSPLHADCGGAQYRALMTPERQAGAAETCYSAAACGAKTCLLESGAGETEANTSLADERQSQARPCNIRCSASAACGTLTRTAGPHRREALIQRRGSVQSRVMADPGACGTQQQQTFVQRSHRHGERVKVRRPRALPQHAACARSPMSNDPTPAPRAARTTTSISSLFDSDSSCLPDPDAVLLEHAKQLESAACPLDLSVGALGSVALHAHPHSHTPVHRWTVGLARERDVDESTSKKARASRCGTASASCPRAPTHSMQSSPQQHA